ncbi:Rab family, other [Angomonas deanei]|uniref:ADP-ribosylation factor family/Ras of Complex, Roc, domain of DAPkinase/Gtr1/RagA G protein conserved region/Ras family, putative n=1 Tax=Angomonas deanei TaxID=59799 RepID=S9UBA4_9TRYP|nr:Rab family, other [Angomonas deanei]EPY38237.1 Rab family, other [Angomonas deanei]CAD2222589.1 ADP-ribosylation factor family/Ras of Complex, Roc, domain of DAPkinase/Gtr1/RagA G protein conserved region/Ras family, putative [Angomonas deanei]|eukprot:EPY26213.1 Rab family, other [Angomonas deanei]
MEEELAYKIIVIGSVSVGKSNITSRFCDNAYYPDIVPTIGMDFKYTTCATLDKTPKSVRLQVWDTSGQDQFVSLTTAFYRNCQGALLCFDLTNRTSFEDLDTWFELLEKHCVVLPPLLLVGCKLDLVQNEVEEDNCEGNIIGSNRQIARSEGDGWARRHGCLCYIETSAKENLNVSFAFQQLATYVANSTTLTASSQNVKQPSHRLKDNREKQEKKCC